MYWRKLRVILICIVLAISSLGAVNFLLPDETYEEIKSSGITFLYAIVSCLPRAEKRLRLSTRAALMCSTTEKVFTKEIRKILAKKKPTSLFVELSKQRFVIQICFDEKLDPIFVVYVTSSDPRDFIFRSMQGCADGSGQSGERAFGISGLQLGFGALIVGIVGTCAKFCGRAVIGSVSSCVQRRFGVSAPVVEERDGDDIESASIGDGDSSFAGQMSPLRLTQLAGAFAAGMSSRQLWCDQRSDDKSQSKMDELLESFGPDRIVWCKDVDASGDVGLQAVVVVATAQRHVQAIAGQPASKRILFIDALRVDLLNSPTFLDLCIKNEWTLWIQQSYVGRNGVVEKKAFHELDDLLRKKEGLRFILCQHADMTSLGLFSSTVCSGKKEIKDLFHRHEAR